MSEGIVYILVNELMPGVVKIGLTRSSVEKRMRALDKTPVPLPFECFYAARVADADLVESKLHDAFADQRIRQRREFFLVDPERVRSALEIAGGEDVTPRNDVVEDEDDVAALNKARERRSRFNFEMVKIPVGSVLTFSRDPDVTCTTVDHRQVNFRGEVTSLSKSAHDLLHEMGYSTRTVSGPAYWEFEGETLDARRQRMQEG